MYLRRALVLLRIKVTLQLLLLLTQTVLAGGFIGGHYDMLTAHGLVARAIVVVAAVLVVVAILVRRAGGPAAFIGPSAVATLALVGQVALGAMHLVAPHVALGVIMVAVLAVFTLRVWSTPLRTAGPPGHTRRERAEVVS